MNKLPKADKYNKYYKGHCYTLSNLYDDYPLRHLITRAQFRKTLTTFNDILMQSSIDTGKVYQLPNHGGIIGVRKKPSWRQPVNYRLSRDAGKKVMHHNFHSGGLVGVILWDRAKPFYNFVDFGLRNLVNFEPTRPHKRLMAKALKEKNTINKYYDV